MSILWIVGLPLAGALVVLVVREVRLLATILTTATLVTMAILCLAQRQAEAMMLLGRSLSLSPQEAVGLAFCAVLLAALTLYSQSIAPGPLAYPLTLGAMALFAAATMIRNLAISGLLLEMGAMVAVMLIPAKRPGTAMTGMRALVLLALAGPLLLLAAWAMESRAVDPANALLVRIGGLSLIVALGIGLAVVPFHVWLPPIFRDGSPLAVVVLSVVLNVTLVLLLRSVTQTSLWSGGVEFFSTLLLFGGMATVLVGGGMALGATSLSRALAFAALADLGLVLIGLGLNTPSSLDAATFQVVYRGLGIATVSMSLGIIQHCLGGDEFWRLRGAMRRTPLAILGLVLGGFSLAGLPLTAGFTSHLLLYQALASQRPDWAMLVMAGSVGPAWAFVRCAIGALVPVPTSAGQREPLLAGLVVVFFSLLLFALGAYPRLLALIPWESLGISLQALLGL
jgi:multicomponent K+:H+ antiporter subunit A